jgi:hypothetical protein
MASAMQELHAQRRKRGMLRGGDADGYGDADCEAGDRRLAAASDAAVAGMQIPGSPIDGWPCFSSCFHPGDDDDDCVKFMICMM